VNILFKIHKKKWLAADAGVRFELRQFITWLAPDGRHQSQL